MASLNMDFWNGLPGTGSSAAAGTPYVQPYGYGGIPSQYHKYISVAGNQPRLLPPQYNSRGAQVLDLDRAAAEQAFYKEYYPDYEGFLGGGADQDGGLGAARDGIIGRMRPPDYPTPTRPAGSDASGNTGGSGTGGGSGRGGSGGSGGGTAPAPYTALLQQQPIGVQSPGTAAVPGALLGYSYGGDVPSGWALGPTTQGTGLRAGANLTQVKW